MTTNYLKPLVPPLPDPYIEDSWEANFFDELFWDAPHVPPSPLPPITTTFSLVNSQMEQNSVAAQTAVINYAAPAAGDYLIAIATTRMGTNAVDGYSLTDANSGVWTELAVHENEPDSVTHRLEMKLYGRKATAADAAGAFDITFDPPNLGTAKKLVVLTIRPSVAVDLALHTIRTRGTGTSEPTSFSSGTINPVTDQPLFGFCFAITKTGTPPSSGFNLNKADTGLTEYVTTQAFSVAFRFWGDGQYSGPFNTIASWGSASDQAIVGVAAFTITPTIAAPVGQIKFWDGAAFVSKPAKHWTGAAWVTKPVRRWGGSAWSPPPTVPPPTIASIVDASAKDATYLNYNDNSKMSQLYTEPPGNVNNGDTVAKCLPSAGALRSETQTSLWQYRPVWQANGGVGRLFFGDTFDPGHSLYGITSLNPNTTLIIVAQLSNVKKTSFFERFNGINYVWKAESGSTDPHASHPGSPTFRIDGAAFNGNSGALYNLNTDLQRHIYTAENLDFTGRTDGSLVLANSAFTGFHLNGYIYDVVLVSDISVDERNTIEAELAAKHSITLP